MNKEKEAWALARLTIFVHCFQEIISDLRNYASNVADLPLTEVNKFELTRKDLLLDIQACKILIFDLREEPVVELDLKPYLHFLVAMEVQILKHLFFEHMKLDSILKIAEGILLESILINFQEDLSKK